jgi:hypothetical protein
MYKIITKSYFIYLKSVRYGEQSQSSFILCWTNGTLQLIWLTFSSCFAQKKQYIVECMTFFILYIPIYINIYTYRIKIL